MHRIVLTILLAAFGVTFYAPDAMAAVSSGPHKAAVTKHSAPLNPSADSSLTTQVIQGIGPVVTTSTQQLTNASTGTASVEYCYSVTYWRAGLNVVGITLWKVWNHAHWCGVPYSHIIKGSVYGNTTIYDCCLWSSNDKSWAKRTVSATARMTNAYSEEDYGVNGNNVQSESINVTIEVFANGVAKWGSW